MRDSHHPPPAIFGNVALCVIRRLALPCWLSLSLFAGARALAQSETKIDPETRPVSTSSQPIKVGGPIVTSIGAERPRVTRTPFERSDDLPPNIPRPDISPPVVATARSAGPFAVPTGSPPFKPGKADAKAKTQWSATFAESLSSVGRPRSLPLVTKWAQGASANGANVIDPQIAAGSSLVAVLTWDTLAFYYKDGELATGFTNPTDTETIFADIVNLIDANLNLATDAEGNSDFLMENGSVGDARIAFDRFRHRWVVAGTAKNSNSNLKTTVSNELRLSQRRTKFLLAVSREEDPAKGFYTYYFDATPDDGACSSTSDSAPCPGTNFTPGNAGDYPSIGISKTHYLITDHVAHEPLNGAGGQALFGYLVTLDADAAARGAQDLHASAFFNWDLADEGVADFWTMPVVMANDLPEPGEGWGIIASASKNYFSLTAVSPDNPPSLSAMSWSVSNMERPPEWSQKGSTEKISYGSSNEPTTAMLFGTTLVAGFGDARTWTGLQSLSAPSLHLISIDLTSFPSVANKVKDRVIGWRNAVDDPASDVVGYGLPGIAVNKDGDIAVVYSRTSSRLFMETRFSTWLHDEADIRPSRILRAGEASIGKHHPDTAGVSLDPFDDQAIWMAHEYASATGTRVAVGKVFGEAHPDVAVMSAGIGSTSHFQPGDHVEVNLTMKNHGDGVAREARGEALLFEGDLFVSLGETIAADLQPGASVVTHISGTIPGWIIAGPHQVKLRSKVKPGTSQYPGANQTIEAGQVVVE